MRDTLTGTRADIERQIADYRRRADELRAMMDAVEPDEWKYERGQVILNLEAQAQAHQADLDAGRHDD